MKVLKMRDGSAFFISKEINLAAMLSSNKRFISIDGVIINRVDITAVLSKEQYDDSIKLKNGMVLTSQGWMSNREYTNNSFLRIKIPESLVLGESKLLEEENE
jgi:hypothetical protein